MTDLNNLLEGVVPFLKHPSVEVRGGQPVLHAVRSTATGMLVGVNQKGAFGSSTTLDIFSGSTNRLTGRRLRPDQKNGEIPQGTWYIVRRSGQNIPAESLRVLNSRDVLGPDGEYDYDSVTSKKLWLSLYRDDTGAGSGERIDDITVDGGTERTGVAAHFGEASNGCFTFKDVDQYKTFLRKMAKTPPTYHDSRGNPVKKGTPGAIEVYGKLVVGGMPIPMPRILR